MKTNFMEASENAQMVSLTNNAMVQNSELNTKINDIIAIATQKIADELKTNCTIEYDDFGQRENVGVYFFNVKYQYNGRTYDTTFSLNDYEVEGIDVEDIAYSLYFEMETIVQSKLENDIDHAIKLAYQKIGKISDIKYLKITHDEIPLDPNLSDFTFHLSFLLKNGRRVFESEVVWNERVNVKKMAQSIFENVTESLQCDLC